MSNKPMTLTDLARIAGVSESTVSRALNNNKLISEKTRHRVQALAQEHSFSINTTARSLRTQKSHTVAVVLLIGSEQDQSASDPFILSILGVIADELNARGYDMLLSRHSSSEKQWLDNYLSSKKADGVILFGQEDNADELVSKVRGKPVVVWGAATQEDSYITVGTDNLTGGRLLTQHLLQQGCKNLLFLGQLSYEIEQRYLGFSQALTESESHGDFQSCHFSHDSSYQKVCELLNRNSFNYDGIVAASDSIALGAIRALTEHGLNVPRDVAVTGYDDVAMAAYVQPALTTVAQNTQLGGKMLVESLFNLINHEEVSSTTLPTELIVRGSSTRDS